MTPYEIAATAKSVLLAILPEGTVRDEGAFFFLLIILGALAGVALYLRAKRKREEKETEDETAAG